MEASLLAHSVRNFKKILQCMAKFGEELDIHATHEGLQLATVNSTKTAFCMFSLGLEAFDKYRLSGPTVNLPVGSGVKARLLVKSVLSVLGRGPIPQSVERLDLQIKDPSNNLKKRKSKRQKQNSQNRIRDDVGDEEQEDDNESIQAKLILKLVCKHGVLKTHSLNLSSSEFLVANVHPDSLTNLFVIPARTLRDWLDHFAVSGSTIAKPASESTGNINRYETELGWLFDAQEVRVRTCEAGNAGRKTISTEIKVAVTEFEEYKLSAVTQLTFPMREFKAAIALADSWSISLRTDFSEPGQPMKMNIEIEGVVGEFIVGTTEYAAFADVPQVKAQQQQGEARESTAIKNERNRSASGNDPANAVPLVDHRSTRNPPSAKKAGLPLVRDAQGNFPVPQHVVDDEQNANGQEPLFYPGASQMIVAGGDMDQAEARAMSQRELEQLGEGDLDAFFAEEDDDGDVENQDIDQVNVAGDHANEGHMVAGNRHQQEQETADSVLGPSMFDRARIAQAQGQAEEDETIEMQQQQQMDEDETMELPATQPAGGGHYQSLFDD